MSSLRFTASAENDLLETWRYLAEKNPAAADRLLDQIVAEAQRLLAHPAQGRRRDELAAGLRSWPTATTYLLYYFIDDAGIVIARVLHHARDVPAIESWPIQSVRNP